MPRFHNVDGEQIQFTEAEEAAWDAEKAAWEAGANDRAMAALRAKRNQLLQDCDWTQSRDITLANDDAWKSYRSQLRDFPASVDLSNISWPEEPA